MNKPTLSEDFPISILKTFTAVNLIKYSFFESHHWWPLLIYGCL